MKYKLSVSIIVFFFAYIELEVSCLDFVIYFLLEIGKELVASDPYNLSQGCTEHMFWKML